MPGRPMTEEQKRKKRERERERQNGTPVDAAFTTFVLHSLHIDMESLPKLTELTAVHHSLELLLVSSSFSCSEFKAGNDWTGDSNVFKSNLMRA